MHKLRRLEPPEACAVECTYTVDEITQGLKRHEFEPFFQPKVELATGRVAGFEALARWRRPGTGIIAPVAEGVETQEEWDLLRALGCDLAQGYFISKPMESDAVLPWVREWKLRFPA